MTQPTQSGIAPEAVRKIVRDLIADHDCCSLPCACLESAGPCSTLADRILTALQRQPAQPEQYLTHVPSSDECQELIQFLRDRGIYTCDSGRQYTLKEQVVFALNGVSGSGLPAQSPPANPTNAVTDEAVAQLVRAIRAQTKPNHLGVPAIWILSQEEAKQKLLAAIFTLAQSPPQGGGLRPGTAVTEGMCWSSEAKPAPGAEAVAEKGEAYRQRNVLVAALSRLFPSGIRSTNIAGWSPDWHGCVYIDLPTGQISYHYHDKHAFLFENLPPYTKEWDGHDKDKVHERLLALRPAMPAPAQGVTETGVQSATDIVCKAMRDAGWTFRKRSEVEGFIRTALQAALVEPRA